MNTKLTKQGYIIPKKELKNVDDIKEELIAKPKMTEYEKEQKMFPVYLENKNELIVPRHYGIKMFGQPKKDELYHGRDIKIKFKGQLRDYQKNISDMIFNSYKTNGGGVLTLPCGRGKTIIAIESIVRLQKKTLIIVHKEFLMKQWYRQLQRFTTASIGKIQRDRVDVKGKDVVLAMLKSVSMKEYKKDTFDEFGLTIVDECHHIAAEVYSRSLPKITSKYTLGLSATPRRLDGLSKIFYWHLGNTIYKEELRKNNNVHVKMYQYTSDNKLFKMILNWYTKKPNATKMLTNITLIPERNQLIVDRINERRRRGDYCKMLILSGRREHLSDLKEMVTKSIEEDKAHLKMLYKLKKVYESELVRHTIKNVPPLNINGNIINSYSIEPLFSQEELNSKLDKINNELDIYEKAAHHETAYYWGGMKEASLNESEDKDIIFGTYDMASEGLDISSLNTIVLATPKPNVVQSVGRILRLEEYEVSPEVIDIADQLSLFFNYSKSRIKYYTDSHYHIHTFKVDKENLSISKLNYVNTITLNNNRIIDNKNINELEFVSDSD